MGPNSYVSQALQTAISRVSGRQYANQIRRELARQEAQAEQKKLCGTEYVIVLLNV